MADRLVRDRREAGRVLAGRLQRYQGRGDVVVFGLPRGGVPVACEVAAALGVPSTSFSCASSGFPATKRWPWGRSPAAGCSSSTTMSSAAWGSPPRSSGRWPSRRAASCCDASRRTGMDGQPRPSRARPSSWSTTVWRRGQHACRDPGAAAAAAGRDRRAGRPRVDLPGAGGSGRRGGLRNHAIAVPGSRPVLLGLHPDNRRRGTGPAWGLVHVAAGRGRRARSDRGGRHPLLGRPGRERRTQRRAACRPAAPRAGVRQAGRAGRPGGAGPRGTEARRHRSSRRCGGRGWSGPSVSSTAWKPSGRATTFGPGRRTSSTP